MGERIQKLRKAGGSIKALLVFPVAVCGALLAGESTPATPTTSGRELCMPARDVPGVGNFAKISDVLYRGEQPTATGFAELKKRGIKTIINLRSFHSDRSEMKGNGLNYLHIYCKAWHPEDEDVVTFLQVVKDPAHQPVFVHCQHGADRTGMMVAAYRIMEQGWSVEDAAKETHNFGFHKMFKDIQKYLKEFDRERLLKRVESTPPEKVELVK